MKKRSLIIFSLLLISLSFYVNASSSEDNRTIEIIGCTTQRNSYIQVGSCDLETGQYCIAHDTILNGFSDLNACLKGVSPPTDRSPYGPGCCPPNSDCAYDSDRGGYLCKYATIDCTEVTDESECNDNYGNRCIWQDGSCHTRVRGCYGYLDESRCITDPQNVAQIDVNCNSGETKSLGGSFIIKRETCQCYWNGTMCGLRYNITSSYGQGLDVGFCKFLMQKGECIGGFQSYSYVVDEFDSGSMNLLQGDAHCVGSSGIIRCGEPVVKVSFFNLLNAMAVILLISLFYIHKTKLKKALK